MSHGLTRSERGVLATVALGAILAPLNSTMIAVALPSIVHDFDSGVRSVGLLVTSYLLALAVVQPIAGKLGDRYGRRPFVLGGLTAFGMASLGAAVAPSLPLLIAFRVVQALAIAVVFPNGSGLVRELIPAQRRAGAFGVVGASLGLAAALGPPLGGLLISVGGWRSVFYVNVPFVAAGLVFAWRFVPRPAESSPERSTPFDLVGSLLLVFVLGGASALVTSSRHVTLLILGVSGLILGGALWFFVRRALEHPDPVVQLRFFARRGFAAASAGVAASNLGFYSMLLATPILLVRVHAESSATAGLVLAFLSAPMVALSPIGGRFADLYGRRAPAVAGCGLLALGLVPLVFSPGLSFYGLFVCLALAGAGVGLSSAGMQTAALEAVGPAQAGVASGLFSTCRYIGGFVGSIAIAHFLDSADGLSGFRSVFLIALAGALVSIVASCALPRPK